MKHANLVIDVGMHRGEDTRFYLDKGFDVVAIEANPSLVAQAEREFEREIDAGRLRIRGVAVTEDGDSAVLAIADEAAEWSTLDQGFAERNRRNSGTRYRHVEVPAVRFADILADVGVPHYLKIDIEGLDMLCVRALRTQAVRPDFVSVESAVSSLAAPLEAAFDELAELWTLGYRRFGYVNQNAHPWRTAPWPAREGAYVDGAVTSTQSGFFGDELPVAWSGLGATLMRGQALRIHHNLSGNGGAWTRNPLTRPYWWLARSLWRARHGDGVDGWRGWWDLHARLD